MVVIVGLFILALASFADAVPCATTFPDNASIGICKTLPVNSSENRGAAEVCGECVYCGPNDGICPESFANLSGQSPACGACGDPDCCKSPGYEGEDAAMPLFAADGTCDPATQTCSGCCNAFVRENSEDAADSACCNTNTSCVFEGRCYAPNTLISNPAITNRENCLLDTDSDLCGAFFPTQEHRRLPFILAPKDPKIEETVLCGTPLQGRLAEKITEIEIRVMGRRSSSPLGSYSPLQGNFEEDISFDQSPSAERVLPFIIPRNLPSTYDTFKIQCTISLEEDTEHTNNPWPRSIVMEQPLDIASPKRTGLPTSFAAWRQTCLRTSCVDVDSFFESGSADRELCYSQSPGQWVDADDNQSYCQAVNTSLPWIDNNPVPCQPADRWGDAGLDDCDDADPTPDQTTNYCCGDDLNETFADSTGFVGGNKSCCAAPNACVWGGGCHYDATETLCGDGIDNDCDGFTDNCDIDCNTAANCPFVNGTITSCDNISQTISQTNVLLLGRNTLDQVKSYGVSTNSQGYFNVGAEVGSYDLTGSKQNFLATTTPINVAVGVNQYNFCLTSYTGPCEADCSYQSDSVCHATCQGTNGCLMNQSVFDSGVCNNREVGQVVAFNATHDVVCCGGAPYPQTSVKGTVQTDSENAIKVTRVVYYKGKLARANIVVAD
ncbi:hypothetical protein HZB01_02980 [Candidatus Woesearchaeota archaeon]|nr:hypothetical protein [Candidatus Woesearchaeota archaeon]